MAFRESDTICNKLTESSQVINDTVQSVFHNGEGEIYCFKIVVTLPESILHSGYYVLYSR